ncbi:MAG: 50S ribosomal protein L9 [Candidatus Omnitrophica bacterium]|nr:50S ribosomal protein L9 [Candidatus Omnitrophota bacterium]
MKVVLKENIKNLGNLGDVIEISAGYARNYLIPKGKALEATKGNLKLFEDYKRIQMKKYQKEKEQAEQAAKKLSGVSCTIVMPANEEQLYGSVTNAHISEALQQEGITIDKKDILLEEPIKALGVYQVTVKIHPEVKQQVKVWVVKK